MDGFLKAEDVEKIQVTNYNYELQKQAQSDMSVAEAYDVDAALVMGREKEYIADSSEYIKNAVRRRITKSFAISCILPNGSARDGVWRQRRRMIILFMSTLNRERAWMV